MQNLSKSLSLSLFLFFLIIGLLGWGLPTFARPIHSQILHQGHSIGRPEWNRVLKDFKGAIPYLFEVLSSTPMGKNLLMAAKTVSKKRGNKLESQISLSAKSYTDTTVVRKYNLKEPLKTHFSIRSVVKIQRDNTLFVGVLDLAHELVHFTYRPPVNPYLSTWSFPEFFRQSLEGAGGEVEALSMECIIRTQLIERYFNSNENLLGACRQYVKEDGVLKYELLRAHFYRVGANFKELRKKFLNLEMGQRVLNSLTDLNPVFTSSIYNLPYPLAIYYEFEQMTQKVCDNDMNRLVILKRKNHEDSLYLERKLKQKCAF